MKAEPALSPPPITFVQSQCCHDALNHYKLDNEEALSQESSYTSNLTANSFINPASSLNGIIHYNEMGELYSVVTMSSRILLGLSDRGMAVLSQFR